MAIRGGNLEVEVYQSKHKSMWNDFTLSSKNGVFLFCRDYMEYHSDRFQDHSLLFFSDGKLVGLLPANVSNNVLSSHAGLTFGGIISDGEMSTKMMLNIFEAMIDHCKGAGITEIVYKVIPYIFHSVPSGEDQYALFRYGAKLLGRNVFSSIYMPSRVRFSKNRRNCIKRALDSGLCVKQSFDFCSFMKIGEEVLKARHGAAPVHSATELELLAKRFPENIKLFASFKNDVMLAGVIIYENTHVAHAQYAFNSDEGLKLGAEDVIFGYLISDYYKSMKYFDFGCSNEQLGQILNEGLISYKEGFGAQAIPQDIYQLFINDKTFR